MLALEVAGSPAYLEPDAVVVDPAGRWTVIEIKSFPMIDASADAAKVGAAARQSAVYVLALERIAAHINSADSADSATVHDRILLVCPKDFSNLPTASAVDVRKQLAVTRRQLARLTRVEDIAAALPEGTTFDPGRRPPSSRRRSNRSVRRTHRSAWPHANWPSTAAAGPVTRARWRRWAGEPAASWAG